MKEFIDGLSSGLASNILAIIGLAAAYWFYRKSLKFTHLSYHSEWVEVVGYDTPSDIAQDLTILYKGTPVKKVSVCKVTIWNSGTETLPGSFISIRDPLRIRTDKLGKILSAEALKVSRDACGIALTSAEGDDTFRQVTFDFLDPGDGVLLKIIHTDERPWIVVAGAVRSTKIKDASWSGSIYMGRRMALKGATAISIAGSGMLAYWAYVEENLISFPWPVGLALLGSMFCAFITWKYGIRRPLIEKPKFPRNLGEL